MILFYLSCEQCADLVFTASASDDSPDGSCKNGTGVTASPFPTSVGRINANESTANGERQGGSGGGNGDNNQGGKQPSGSAAASLQTAAWGVLGVVVLAAGALL